MAGRPTVMTDEVLQKLEYAFSIGCGDTEACLYADIAPSSLYNHQVKNPSFLERKAELKENPILKARLKVFETIPRDVDTAKWYLERKKKDEFSQRSELTGKDGKDFMPIPILSNVPAHNSNNQDKESHQTTPVHPGGNIGE